MSNSAIFRYILVNIILYLHRNNVCLQSSTCVAKYLSTRLSISSYTHKDVWVAVTEISLAECEMHCVCLRASFDKI